VIVPTIGAEGVTGCVLITTLEETTDVHPASFLTVKLYVPAGSEFTVVVVPVPVEVDPPGYRISVQSPVSGSPLSTTLPVDVTQFGWVITPTNGAAGVSGCSLITTGSEASEVQPDAFLTVKVYVPATMPEIVLFVPVPVVGTLPGERITVHVPVGGSPLRATLPVESAQVGCVIVPITGGVGVKGCALINTLAEETEVHPRAFITLKV
jgi:hypothetical protein